MDQEEAQEFLAPDNGGWHYTIMRDWIAVCPDISATAARLYWIVRSIMHEKGDRKRRLSIDQICWLLPGINGKPSSETRVKTALRELEAAHLLSNPEGDVVRRWVTDPQTGKQTRENYRRWQIHDFPTQGYQGPKSAIALLDEYPGPGWREAATQTPNAPEGRKSAPQASPKPSPGKTKKTAGRTEGRKSASSGRKSASSGRKSGDSNSGTSENAGFKEVLQGSSLSKTSSLGSSFAAGSHGADLDQEEEGVRPKKDSTRTALEEIAQRLTTGLKQHLGPRRKYLLAEPRERVVELLIERLSEGHTEEYLAAQLRRWCGEAKNPSTYLPMQLAELTLPRPKLTMVSNDTSADQPTSEAVHTDDLTAEDLLARGLKPKFLPSRYTGLPKPGSRRRITSVSQKDSKGA
ncbi:hypothetical protein REH65_33385 (plasmid) [Saccharopolyspora sp. ID03-671]|uniref:hypothetical protein n=1 Tax=Saccharopolyspora sp. ID03-671 TaxID=3073066 RepID=UPI0030F3DC74